MQTVFSPETIAAIAAIAREAHESFASGKRITLLSENSKLAKVPGVRGSGWILRACDCSRGRWRPGSMRMALGWLLAGLQRAFQWWKQHAEHETRHDRAKDLLF